MSYTNRYWIIAGAIGVALPLSSAYVCALPVEWLGEDGCVPPPPSLLGWWPGDGDAQDIAGDLSGTILGGMGFAQGMVGQAFSLDNVNDGAEIPNTDDVWNQLDEWTLVAWVFPHAEGWDRRNDPIVWKTGGGNDDTFYIAWGCFNCSLTNRFQTGLERITDGKDFNATSEPHSPSAWYHVAGVYDGTDLIIYVNGFEEGRNTIGPVKANTAPDPLRIGNILHTDHANKGVFDGLIDEVGIFDRPLLAEEIAAIYLAGSAGMCKPIEGDLDSDGAVDTTDLIILLGDWGRCADCSACPSDLHADCTVNSIDLLILLSNWG